MGLGIIVKGEGTIAVEWIIKRLIISINVLLLDDNSIFDIFLIGALQRIFVVLGSEFLKEFLKLGVSCPNERKKEKGRRLDILLSLFMMKQVSISFLCLLWLHSIVADDSPSWGADCTYTAIELEGTVNVASGQKQFGKI